MSITEQEVLHDVEIQETEGPDAILVEEFADLAPDSSLTHLDANRIVRRIKESDDATAKIEEQLEYEISCMRRRAESLIKRHASKKEWLISRFSPALQAFTKKELEGKKEKSVNLLSGTIGYRQVQSSLSIVDMDKAVEFAKLNSLEVKVKETVDAKVLKKHFEETGEELPFAEYKKAENKFYIK